MAELRIDHAVSALLPRRPDASHKHLNGSVLIVAGSASMPGAAILAAMGAVRSGAGRVTVAAVDEVARALTVALPEALVWPLPGRGETLTPEAVPRLIEAQERFDAAVFGPGLTTLGPVLEALSAFWEGWKKPSVLDADALNAIALGVAPPLAPCLYTPHEGEASRLAKRQSVSESGDREERALALAKALGGAVVLKGRRTEIADAGGASYTNDSGNSGMACAGMGDVLSGVCGTLLAQGLSTFDAGRLAAHWHGLAGDLAAAEIGAVGFTPSEVAARLPRAREAMTAS